MVHWLMIWWRALTAALVVGATRTSEWIVNCLSALYLVQQVGRTRWGNSKLKDRSLGESAHLAGGDSAIGEVG